MGGFGPACAIQFSETELLEQYNSAYTASLAGLLAEWAEQAGDLEALLEQADPDDLVAWCRERLAAYKCPKTADIVPELPRNPTGKVLKRELRKPYWEGRDRQVV